MEELKGSLVSRVLYARLSAALTEVMQERETQNLWSCGASAAALTAIELGVPPGVPAVGRPQGPVGTAGIPIPVEKSGRKRKSDVPRLFYYF